jgi:peptidoglycan hydrolase-like protein with peptidoglycan-binding domain
MPSRPQLRRVVARLLAPASVAAIGVLLLAGPAVAAWPDERYPVQSLGDRGTDVIAIQLLLRQLGHPLTVTGLYDAATVTEVKALESASKLPVDGIADARVWLVLGVRVEPGMRGEAVRALQRELNEKRGTSLPVDGVFGSQTRAAVLAFQRHASIGQTGVVGPVTWKALVWHFERPRFIKATMLCDYSVGNAAANWATASAIAHLEIASAAVGAKGYGRVAVGDAGFEHGGDIPGHMTHEVGLDVDIRPMRHSHDQCSGGTNWRLGTYDRAATRVLIRAIRAAAPGHVKLIYFNDPVLIREGMTTWFAGHDDHLHIRYCQALYPDAMYRC